jgi:hypothetical protein
LNYDIIGLTATFAIERGAAAAAQLGKAFLLIYFSLHANEPACPCPLSQFLRK